MSLNKLNPFKFRKASMGHEGVHSRGAGEREGTPGTIPEVPRFFECGLARALANVNGAKEIAPSYEAISSIAVEQRRFGQTSGITTKTIDALLLRVTEDSVNSITSSLQLGSPYRRVVSYILPQDEDVTYNKAAAVMIANVALSIQMAKDALISVKFARDSARAYNSMPLGWQRVPAARLEQLVQIEQDAHRVIAEQSSNFAALYAKGGEGDESLAVGLYVNEAREHAAKAGLEGSIEGRIAQIMANAHVNSAKKALVWASSLLYNPADSEALEEMVQALVDIYKTGDVHDAPLSPFRRLMSADERITRPYDPGSERLKLAEENLHNARTHLKEAGLDVNKGTGELEKIYRHLQGKFLRAQTGNTLANG